MGDVRFDQPYERLLRSEDRVRTLYEMSDDEVIQSLAAASKSQDAFLANVIATEAMNRMRRSRTAMQHLGEGVVACDVDGRITSLNPAASRLLGYSREELVGKDIHRTLLFQDEHGCELPRERSPLLRVGETGSVVTRDEEVFTRKDGSRIFVTLTAAPIRIENEIHGFVSVFRDVSERREAELRLRRSEQRYRTLYHSVPFMTFTVTSDLRIRTINDVTVEQLGYSREELEGSSALALYVPEERAHIAESLKQVLTGDQVHQHEARKRLRDGRVITVSESIARSHDPDGEPILLILCEDITARKRAEAALEETRERLLSLVRGSPDGIVTIDLEGIITGANPATFGFTGYLPEELIGHSFTEYVDPEALERVWGLFEKVVQGQAQRTEFAILHREGRRVVARVTGIPIITSGEVVGVHGILEDLTVERRAQMVHTQMARAAIDAIVTIDAQGSVVDWNPAAEEIFGYTRDEAIGRNMGELIVPERHRQAHADGVRRAAQAGERPHVAHRYELPALRKDGSEFDAEISITALATPEPLFTGFVRDVTTRRRQEESAARHRLLMEAVKEYAIIMLDPEGRVTSWNKGAERLKGYTADEILGTHFRIFYTPEEQERRLPEKALERALERGHHEAEGWRRRKDGSRFWARATLTPMFDEQGALQGFAKVTRDLSQSRETAEILRKRAHQHAVVAQLGLDGLQGLPLQGLFGRAVEELRGVLGVDYTKILQLDPDGRTLTLRAARGWTQGVRVDESRVSAGLESQAGFTLVTKEPVVVEDLRTETRFDGPDLLVEHGVVSGMSVVIHGMERPWGVLGVHSRTRRDFTQDEVDFLQSTANALASAIQRRESEQRLESRVEERTRSLEEANRDFQTFANAASHDLRAPVRGIDALLVAALEDHGDEMPPDARDILERALRENRRAGRILQDLLAFARSAQGAISRTRVDLTSVCREVAEDIDAHHTDRATTWIIEEGMDVLGDPKLVRIAMQNLLDNASKYSSRSPEPRVKVSTEVRDGMTVISVEDNGIGFDPAESYRLFQPFNRLSSAQGFEGTGLGLATTQRIAVRHGGRLEATSAPGSGTTMRLLLPQ